MKRFFVPALFMAIIFCSPAFAAAGIPAAVVSSFQQKFTNATEVVYSEINEMIRVEFYSAGQKQMAYYNSEGDLLVVARPVSIEQLPAQLQQELKSRYAGYAVKEVEMLSQHGRNEYFLFAENAKKEIILHAPGNKWRSFRIRNK